MAKLLNVVLVIVCLLLSAAAGNAPAIPISSTRAAQVVATASSSIGSASVPAANATASLPPEVRLRKLHLVRPDLILYPIAYEYVC